MTEVQGKGMGTLNIERIYSTTVPAEELAPDAGGPLPRAGVRGTGLPHQREPHGDAGAQGEPVAPTAGGHLRVDRGLHPPSEGQLSIGLGVTSGSMRR
jgi:hypothetical protein